MEITIEEAKDIYKRNNCSLFVMAREDNENYAIYKKLNIDKMLERRWKEETIKELTKLLRKAVSVRSGMVFGAYAIGESKKVILLLEKAQSFINIETDDEQLKERAGNDMKKLKGIAEALKL